MKHDFIENEIIILSKNTLDIFLKDDNPRDLISLYCFYYYTAKWQKTNQPKANLKYCAKGLKCGIDKIRKNKQKLVKLDLIEDAKDIDKKTGKVKGWYIKVKYIWKQENHPINSTSGGENKNNSTLWNEPQGGTNHRVDDEPTNALSANSLNALSANSLNASKEENANAFLDKDRKELIFLFKEVNPNYELLFARRNQGEALKRMFLKFGREKLENTIKALPKIIYKKYAPKITTPIELENNLAKLIAFYKQEKSKGEELKNKTAVII
jgi:hypothetical protein